MENKKQEQMEIYISAKDYFNELKLMQKQYGQEEDLYPWVYMILQWAKIQSKNKNISIRTVAGGSSTKKVPGRKLIKAFGAFPDFAVLDENFDASKDDENLDKLYGCVEVKKIHEKPLEIFKEDKTYEIQIQNKLWPKFEEKACGKNYPFYKSGSLTDDGELLAEVLWYGKVLYTNGLCWKLLTLVGINNAKNNVLNFRNSFKGKSLKEPVTIKALAAYRFKVSVKTLANLGTYNKKSKQIDINDGNEKWDKLREGLVEMFKEISNSNTQQHQ